MCRMVPLFQNAEERIKQTRILKYKPAAQMCVRIFEMSVLPELNQTYLPRNPL